MSFASTGNAFHSYEHIYIGDWLKIPCLTQSSQHEMPTIKSQLAKWCTIPLENKSYLSFGQIIALAGDFYGYPYNSNLFKTGLPILPISNIDLQASELFEPIFSSEKNRFQSAFNTLYKAGNDVELRNIIHVMQKQEKYAMTNTHYDPTCDFEYATGALACYAGIPSPIAAFNGRYIKLAQSNIDHFGIHALRTYMIGHSIALTCAKAVKHTQKINHKWDALSQCLSIEAFSLHFLTDLFSTGHIRTPRVELLKKTTISPLISGGLLAKKMHDEDSLLGLSIKNIDGNSWYGYGDNELLKDKSEKHREMIISAVQLSLDEVSEAFYFKRSYNLKQFAALRKVPLIEYMLPDYSDHLNIKDHYALFLRHQAQNKVYRRKYLHQPNHHEYKRKWNAILSLF